MTSTADAAREAIIAESAVAESEVSSDMARPSGEEVE